MKEIKKNGKAKKLVALVLIATLALGSIFASPLNLAGSAEDAKLYNENYKAVSNPNQVNDSWIIRTKDSPISFENQSLKLTVGENSLVQLTSLDDKAPVVYLLDGWLSASSADGVELTILTTVTTYAVNAGSNVIVISNEQAEHGYVQQGKVAVTNGITGTNSKLEEGNYLDLSQANAQPSQPEETSQLSTILAKVMVTEPVAEPEPVVETQPATEPAAEPEPVAETQPETEPEAEPEPVVETQPETEPEAETEPVVETQPETEPEAETEPVVETQPATEPEAETEPEVKVEAEATPISSKSSEAELAPLTKTFSYAGYEATITAYVGKAIVEYPSFVTAQEIYDAAKAAYNAYADYLDGVYLQVVEDGKAVITYPETYGQAEFNLAVELLDKELPYYIASLFAQPETAEITEIAVVEGPLTKTFNYRGFSATVTAYQGMAIIEYPTYVTNQEIYTAAEAAYKAYGKYLDGVYFQIVEEGKAVVTYPETYGEEEFNFAVSILEVEVPFYVASILGNDAPNVKTEAEVTYSVEEVRLEITAPDSPAQKPSTETQEVEETTEVAEVPAEAETTKTPEAPAETKVEVEIKAKKNESSVKFGATVAVVYGQYKDETDFTPFIDEEDFNAVGFAPKNATIIVDPYISVGNFKFGLHLSMDVQNFEKSFTFDTESGVSGYINSIAKYVGNINYNSANVNINIDRNHSVEFSSPVFHSMDKAFDKNNSLVASASFNLGFLKINAFVDDLQLTNYLNNEAQYAGLSLTAGNQYVNVTASAIAKAYSLENIDFYPAIDATASFNVGNVTTVNLYAGLSGLYSNSELSKTFLGKFKINLDFSNVFNFGLGAAYNYKAHTNDCVNNSYLTVTTPFEGNSLDILLSSGLHLGFFSIDNSMSIPLYLKEDNAKLVNNTITTASGEKKVSPDVMNLSATLDFGIVSLSSGVFYNGFTKKLFAIGKAIKYNTGIRDSLMEFIDPTVANFYTKLTVKLGGFEAYAKGTLVSLEEQPKLSTTIGASFTF